MAGSGDLYDVALEFLDACVLALADTPAGPPDRVFVSSGMPAYDCCSGPSGTQGGQLTVHVGSPAPADTLPLQPVLAPGHRTAVQGQVNLVQLVATILRCSPVMAGEGDVIPPVANLQAVAQQTDADVWAILAHVKERKRRELLFTPKDRELFIDTAVPLPSEGGCVGWQIVIRVALDGYRPDLSILELAS